MLAMERARYIVGKLEKNKVVLVAELSKEMNVSEETIRKDLEKLEKQEQICRVHGGAYLKEGYGNETSVNVREQIYQEETTALGRQCVNFIEKNEIIILDCSTTARYIARAIGESGLKVTVITNSLATAYELSQNSQVRVLMLGGELDRNTGSFNGSLVLEALERYHADKVFLSSAGISAEAGITDYRQNEADVRRKMICQADQCYFVADRTKIGRHAAFIVGDFGAVQHLIVEQPIEGDPALKKKLEEARVTVTSCVQPRRPEEPTERKEEEKQH